MDLDDQRTQDSPLPPETESPTSSLPSIDDSCSLPPPSVSPVAPEADSPGSPSRPPDSPKSEPLPDVNMAASPSLVEVLEEQPLPRSPFPASEPLKKEAIVDVLASEDAAMEPGVVQSIAQFIESGGTPEVEQSFLCA